MNILSSISFGVPQKKETLWVWNNTRSEQMMRRGEDGPMGSTDLLCSSLKTGLPLQTPLSLLSGATGVMMFLGHRTHLQHPHGAPMYQCDQHNKTMLCECECVRVIPCCSLPPPLFLSRDICSRIAALSKSPNYPQSTLPFHFLILLCVRNVHTWAISTLEELAGLTTPTLKGL